MFFYKTVCAISHKYKSFPVPTNLIYAIFGKPLHLHLSTILMEKSSSEAAFPATVLWILLSAPTCLWYHRHYYQYFFSRSAAQPGHWNDWKVVALCAQAEKHNKKIKSNWKAWAHQSLALIDVPKNEGRSWTEAERKKLQKKKSLSCVAESSFKYLIIYFCALLASFQ